MTAASSHADLLAKSGEAMKSGPIGLAIILILCIACYFLFKSMSRHLKTVREDFPTGEPAQAAQPAPPAQPSTQPAQPSTQPAQPSTQPAQPSTQPPQPADPPPPPPAE